jgi:pimeloyl-ACP methyl ester carboxylesterase
VNVNGLQVSECGHGQDVVLVHGSASDHRTWHGQQERWCDTYHLISYSRRFHWPNEAIKSGGVYSLDQHVTDLQGLLLELELGPATLVGHSYGAVVSLVLAARRPELVTRLVLAEPPVLGLFVSVPPTFFQLLKVAIRRPRTAFSILKMGATSMGPAATALERGDEQKALHRLGVGILGEQALGRLSEERRAQVRDNLILEELRSAEALPRLDHGTVASIHCPTLLLEGDRSPRIFSHLMDYLQELLPNSDRVMIPNASHILHEDNPAEFHKAIESFLEGGT